MPRTATADPNQGSAPIKGPTMMRTMEDGSHPKHRLGVRIPSYDAGPGSWVLIKSGAALLCRRHRRADLPVNTFTPDLHVQYFRETCTTPSNPVSRS
ncbi:hypothetical protein [Mycobacterium sp.]|uniref:hypothetical protein n=1 Tax=Mycobacterium sp. TaxID=1785 RepID=UPI003D127C15